MGLSQAWVEDIHGKKKFQSQQLVKESFFSVARFMRTAVNSLGFLVGGGSSSRVSSSCALEIVVTEEDIHL